jgi:hypothetical protein
MSFQQDNSAFRDEAMRTATWMVLVMLLVAAGCSKKPPQYGTERRLSLPDRREQVWAVAPAIDLSGQSVDPILQADLVYAQLQTVAGVKAIPVNRVVEVYASLRITSVQSADQAALVCDLLGADGLVVPTITAWDPYNPPKIGASLQLFARPDAYQRPGNIDVRDLVRQAAPKVGQSYPQPDFAQSVGMFDAADGSVRDRLMRYAAGRNDPLGPLKHKEYLLSIDRYSSFVYHELIEGLLVDRSKRMSVASR